LPFSAAMDSILLFLTVRKSKTAPDLGSA